MKASYEQEYTVVYDGHEDPTLMVYNSTKDHLNNPIAPGTYLIAVSASNYIGQGEKSEPLTVVITYRTSSTST
jgi:hypothetical protein